MSKLHFPVKYRDLLINLLIALAITLFINFTELMALSGPERRWRTPEHFLGLQLLYFFLLSYITLVINTSKRGGMLTKIIITLLVVSVLYCFMPAMTRRGHVIMQWNARWFFDPWGVTRCSIVAIISILYGTIYQLLYQKQRIDLENQQLKNENLQTKYNMLANQISPHFLFNSLTSLSMLVRNKKNDKALQYIDTMSDTFRYMLQSEQTDMTTVEQELAFTRSYMYLHIIRYENKLFFEVNVDGKYMDWKLPNMTLQPLIENAVKHNTITLSKPFTITVKNVGNALVISNPISPKLKSTNGTGIGLKNLSSRYLLLTGKDIKVVSNEKEFSVTLPLAKP